MGDPCEHDAIKARLTVERITQSEGGSLVAVVANLSLMCDACGQDFAFLGLPKDAPLPTASMSADGLTARLPAEPAFVTVAIPGLDISRLGALGSG